MEQSKTTSTNKRLAAWFGLGAMMFGTYCGGSMASGAYATGYMTTFGGGYMLVFLAIFCVFMAFFCAISLNFIRTYHVEDYNEYYLALYGLERTGSQPILKGVVTVFFDVYTVLMGLITTAGTINLFGQLMNSIFGIPIIVGSLISVVLFAILTIYGSGFLRKFNTIMTIGLVICLAAILVAVLTIRGDVFAERFGNFDIGMDWSGTTLQAHMTMFLSYCFTTSSWGSTLCNYSEKIKDQKDAIGAGILIAVLVTALFAVTSFIVLPFLPEMFNDGPILAICQQYLAPALTVIYWVVVIFSVVSTGPTFTYNVSRRFSKLWKTDKVGEKVKFFILSLVFLLLCFVVSNVGLMAIVQKGFSTMGGIAGFAIGIPLFISIYRVWRKNRIAH